jgi:hypothetical protein
LQLEGAALAQKLQRFPEENDGDGDSKVVIGGNHKPYKLGWHKYKMEDPGGRGPGAVFFFEIVFPKNDPKNDNACPTHAKQFVRTTTLTTKSEIRTPPPDPAKNDKGGFDSTDWREDDDATTGKSPVDDTETRGDEKGYTDSPGITKAVRYRPQQKDSAYKVVLYDCHDKILDCITWEQHLVIAADGTITKAEVTKAKSCM